MESPSDFLTSKMREGYPSSHSFIGHPCQIGNRLSGRHPCCILILTRSFFFSQCLTRGGRLCGTTTCRLGRRRLTH
jgi:hypothetical protein